MKVDLYTDVCIIGGGIAGNFLAHLLAPRQIQCIVIEEHSKLGEPFQCAGIIAQKILKIAQFPPELVLNRVKTAEVVAPNLSRIEMAGSESPVVIDRVAFDRYFGEEAIKEGARYFLGEKYIRHWALKNGKTLIKTNKRNILAKLVVGADGPFSQVGKLLGSKVETIPAAQVRAKFSYPAQKTAMYFNSHYRELFGYIVPEGTNGICRIGIGSKNAPHEGLKFYLRQLGVSESQIVSRQGGVIPYGFPKRIAFRNTVLLGDAACMVKATTGGGIVMLMSAAKILASAIKKALAANDFSAKFLFKQYQRPVKITLGLQLKVHYFIRLLLVNLTSYDFNHFFKLYRETELHRIIEQFADMDFPLVLIRRLMFNRQFFRFLIHILFRNWMLLPKYLHDIVM